MKDRCGLIAEHCTSRRDALRVLEEFANSPDIPERELARSSDVFLARLADVFVASPVMAQTLTRHPEWFFPCSGARSTFLIRYASCDAVSRQHGMSGGAPGKNRSAQGSMACAPSGGWSTLRALVRKYFYEE